MLENVYRASELDVLHTSASSFSSMANVLSARRNNKAFFLWNKRLPQMYSSVLRNCMRTNRPWQRLTELPLKHGLHLLFHYAQDSYNHPNVWCNTLNQTRWNVIQSPQGHKCATTAINRPRWCVHSWFSSYWWFPYLILVGFLMTTNLCSNILLWGSQLDTT